MRYLLIIVFLLCGCIPRGIPIEIFTGRDRQDEIVRKKRIISAKNTIIKAIMIESGLSEPEAVILWERYKRSSIKGLAQYLIKTNPFYKQDWIYIDLVDRVKVRTKILKRGYREK